MTNEELQAKILLPPTAAVEGLFPEGSVLFAAKKGAGKSWFLDYVALCVAHNLPVLNVFRVHQGNVILMPLEDTEYGIQDRLRQLQKAMGIEKANPQLHVYPEFAKINDGGLEKLENMILDLRPRLVIIDVLRRFQSTDGAYSKASDKIQILTDLALRTRTSIVGVLHMYRGEISPSAPDWMDRIQGSIGLTGAATTVVGLSRGRDSAEAVLRITGKSVDEQSLALKWDKTVKLFSATGEAETAEAAPLSDRRRDIIKLVEARQGATAQEIADALYNKSYDSAYQRLWQMLKRGQLVRGEESQYFTPAQAEAIQKARQDQQIGINEWVTGDAA